MEFFGDNGDDSPSTYSAPMNLFPEAAESQAAVRHQGQQAIDLNSQAASSFPNMMAYQDLLMSTPATTTPSRSSRKRPASNDPGTLPPRPYRAPPAAAAATRGGRAPSRGAAGRSGTSSRVPATSGGSGGGAAAYRAATAAGGSGGSGGMSLFASGTDGSGGSGGPFRFAAGTGGSGGSGCPSHFIAGISGSGGSSGPSHFAAGIGGRGGSSGPSHFAIGTGGFSSDDGTTNQEEDDHPFGNESLMNLCPLDDEDDEGARDGCETLEDHIAIICVFGMYYDAAFFNKSSRRIPKLSGYEWTMLTLNNPRACFNMFRMTRQVFDSLHNLLVTTYGLRSTWNMSSVEALAMFLWMVGAPQSVRQADNRFERSLGTVSQKFEEVLHCVYKLSKDIIKPRDENFATVHPRVQAPRFSPHFDKCIGAIDGTHVRVVVPSAKVLRYTGRHGYPTQNVLAICDFDMRFTFAVAGWPGSVHDMRVFNDALRKYADKFPHPPPGAFYLVDSGYSNKPGYLAPYKGTKYHLPEFRQGPRPSAKKGVFNFCHSSLRNVIERAFGVLKMKWQILLHIPSYPEIKQTKIILACMALHNFIRESALADEDFNRCDLDENYMPPTAVSSHGNGNGPEEHSMNVFRDSLADALFAMQG